MFSERSGGNDDGKPGWTSCQMCSAARDLSAGADRDPREWLAPGGGRFGTTGSYSTTLVGSTDVTQLIVRLQPPRSEPIDFGHVDLWQAANADTLVWTPLLDWIRRH